MPFNIKNSINNKKTTKFCNNTDNNPKNIKSYQINNISLIPYLIEEYLFEEQLFLPIHGAAIQGNYYIMNSILNTNKIDVNIYNSNKKSALYLSILNGKYETASLLLQQKNINVNGFKIQKNTCVFKNSPIILAIKKQNVFLVEELLKNKNILLNIVENGSTPLHYALQIDNLKVRYKIIKLLLKNYFIDINFEYLPGNLKISALKYTIKKYCKLNVVNNYYENIIMKNILLRMIYEKIKDNKLKVKMESFIDNKDLLKTFLKNKNIFNQSIDNLGYSSIKSGILKKNVTKGRKKYFKYDKLPKDKKMIIDKIKVTQYEKQFEKNQSNSDKRVRLERRKRNRRRKEEEIKMIYNIKN